MRLSFLLIFWVVRVSGVVGQGVRLVVPIGHTGSITSVAFSPDGKYLLTGSGDATAKLWDVKLGREIQTFRGHSNDLETLALSGGIWSVAFSPDGQKVLTCSGDGTAKLWDINTSREIQTFRGHSSTVFSGTFSPDSKKVLTGSNDLTAKLWDIKTGREIQTFRGHSSTVISVAFSPNSKEVLTGSNDLTAKLWDVKTGREIQTFEGHSDNVSSVAFSSDSKEVLTGSDDQTAKLWDIKTGREIQTFVGHSDNIRSVVFSPDGKEVLTGSNDGTAKLWDIKTGREIQTFRGHSSAVNSVAFSPDGQKVLTGSYDKTVKLWDLSSREIQTFGGHSSYVNSLAFSPDGKYVLTGNFDKTAKLWDLQGREIQSFTAHSANVCSVAFSPDSQYVLTGSDDKTAKLWDLQGREIQSFTGHSAKVCSVTFSPDGKYVLTGSFDKTAKLWDLQGREIQSFTGHSASVLSAAFSPDGQKVLTGNSFQPAKLWDLSGREIQSFTDHSFPNSVAFSPDGQKVVTGYTFGPTMLRDLSGRYIQSFLGHSSSVESVAFSPDNQEVLTGSSDNTAKIWDLSGRQIQTLKGHTGGVYSAVFSSNGQYILTSSADNTTKLWSPTTGQNLATLIALDSTDWVVTTPSGLFDASPGAMKLMHYVQGLDVIELDQLKERYYEPGLLAKIMGFDKSELRNVAAFDQVALYPEVKASIEKDRLSISLTERSGGMGKISLFINGKEVQEDINPQRLKNLSLDLNTLVKYYQPDTANTLALRAYNAEGWLKSQAYELAYSPASKTASPTSKVKPRLYALVVGTSDYAGERLDLRFADQDATAMATALTGACGALFGADRTEVRLLCTASGVAGGEASNGKGVSSKANIRQAFADIAAKATSADVLVVYFSGHGLAYGPAEKEQFYYLTKDIGSEDLKDPAVREQYTVSSNEFTQWLTAIPAQKQVMILDACNAGKVVESLATLAQKALDPSQIRALDRMKDRTGMFILTGAAADKVSYEASQYGQGLLTYSLLQGMSGLALTDDKRVDVMRLFQYSRDQVPELAKGIGGVQTPVLAFPTDGSSFDIGIVNAGVKIPVAQVKPVFIRNVFQDEASFDDVLGLTDALEEHLRKLTIKGAQADLIYVDVKEYDNAFSMKGRYTVAGDAVTVRGKLFKGKEVKGEFQVAGKKGDVPGLVQQILEKVRGML